MNHDQGRQSASQHRPFVESLGRVLGLTAVLGAATIYFIAYIKAERYTQAVAGLVVGAFVFVAFISLRRLPAARRWTWRLAGALVWWIGRVLSWPFRICVGRNWGYTLLRTAGMIAAVLGVLTLVFSPRLYKAFKQRQAVAAIEAAGGSVEYSYEYDIDRSADEPYGPAWLRALLGKDFFNDVTTVSFPPGSPELLSQGVAATNPLRELYEVDLSLTTANDDDLGQLPRLRRRGRIYLAGTAISDEGLRHLADQDSAALVDLSYTRVTGAGLKHIAEMRALESLYLHETNVTPADLRSFQQMRPDVVVHWKQLLGEDHRNAFLELTRMGKGFGIYELDSTQPSKPAYVLPVIGHLGDERVINLLKRVKGIRAISMTEEPPTGRWAEVVRQLDEVTHVRVFGNVPADLQAALAGLPIRIVEAVRTDLLQDNLAWIAQLKSLERFEYVGELLDLDEFLAKQNLGSLKELRISGPVVHDRHLQAIGRLSQLEKLSIRPAHAVTDDGLEHLRGLKKLKWLSFYSPRLTDRGIYYLSQVPRLERIESMLGDLNPDPPGVTLSLRRLLRRNYTAEEILFFNGSPPQDFPTLAPPPPWRHELRHAVTGL